MQNKRKNKFYEVYHTDRRLQKRIINDSNFTYRYLLKTLQPYINDITTVLDIGSGVGTIDFYLASLGKNVTGIEISQNAVSIAQKNAAMFHLDKKIRFINAEFPHEINNNKYDMVIFSEVIEHLENDGKALRDIRKVLKPGGYLVITTPSQNAPLFKLGLLDSFDKKVGHVRRYSTESLQSLVEKNGFHTITVKEHEGVLRNFLFTNPVAGKSIRFIKWKLSTIFTFADTITIFLFGTCSIHLVAKK